MKPGWLHLNLQQLQMPYLQTRSHPETPGGHESGGILFHPGASQVALAVKNLPASAGNIRGVGLTPGSRRSPGRGHGNTLQYSCLEKESHGQRSLAGYRVAESNTTEATWHTHTHSTQAPSPREGRALGGWRTSGHAQGQ